MRLFILIALCTSILAFPKPPVENLQSEESVQQLDLAVAVDYLGKFGYISKRRAGKSKLSGLIDVKTYTKGIKEFQKMAGLKPTGRLDEETAKMMSMPRCGVEDTSYENHAEGRSRSKRHNVQGGRWNKKVLKYHILNYTPDMTRSEVQISIKKAFDVWAKHTNLEFVSTNNVNEADIKIKFGSQNHGDGYPFDGQGGTLAHAFFPTHGGAHFDEDEHFTFEGNRGTNLFTVAAHEFGHSLGLGHSSVANSLMAPFYQGYVADLTLHADDIAGIQQIYGKKETDEKATPSTPSKPSYPEIDPTKETANNTMDICGKDISFDAMLFNRDEDAMYAFKGLYYWKIKDSGVAQGYPRRINDNWKGLPGNINAAVYSPSSKRTYFFKGTRMWRYDENGRLESGFPYPVSRIGLPRNPEAAIRWEKDGNIYLFKKNHFYQFSEYSRNRLTNTAIKGRTNQYWEGVPYAVDGAIQWKDDKTYFFKGDNYWRYSDQQRSVDENYPKSIKKQWIGCTDNTNPLDRLREREELDLE